MMFRIFRRVVPCLATLFVASLLLAFPCSVAASTESIESGASALATAVAAALGMAPSDLSLQTLAVPTATDRPATLEVSFGGVPRRLLLTPRSVRAPGFRVLVQGGDGALREVAPPPPATWRGEVEGAPGSRVIAARVGEAWHASVYLPDHAGGEASSWWTVTPARDLAPTAPAGLCAVCREVDLAPPPGVCAVTEQAAERAPRPSDGSAIDFARLAPADFLVLELACDTDFEFYTANGSSVANTVADIEAVINGVADIWELDFVTTIQIPQVIVRAAEPDPYDTTNPFALLTEMRTEWIANQGGVVRDLAQLFVGRDLDGTTVGVGFTDPGICSSWLGYSVVQSRYSTTMANRVLYSAHEIGHNADAAHCDYMDYICRIMCPSLGRCSCGIRSYGPWEAGRIKADLALRACLGTISLDVPHTTLPFADAFPGASPDPTKWTAADKVYVQNGRLELAHGGGYSPEFYLGTVRTLPIAVRGPVNISYKMLSSNVPAGQKLRVEYFDTATRAWVLLNEITAPGGTGAWTTYPHTTPPEARGELFALRFSSYGDTGSSSTRWYIDDVSIAGLPVGAPNTPAAPLLLRDVRPNPFNPRTTVSFACDRERAVRITVRDLAGATVAVLVDRVFAPGEQAIAWDGRDAGGRPCAAGTYLVQLESEGTVESRKAALVK
jgi:hypothetical protein